MRRNHDRLSRIEQATVARMLPTTRYSTVTPAGFDGAGRPMFSVRWCGGEVVATGIPGETHDAMASRVWPGHYSFEITGGHRQGGDE